MRHLENIIFMFIVDIDILYSFTVVTTEYKFDERSRNI